MLKLLLPVIFPSWRFFSCIEASPRIEFAFLQSEQNTPEVWQAFRPRPNRLPLLQGALRLLHNPQWNETLYINSCAERLFDGYNSMREQEILRRICHAVALGEILAPVGSTHVVFRIKALMREAQAINELVTFVSRPCALARVVQKEVL
jgi:hypothetical protein